MTNTAGTGDKVPGAVCLICGKVYDLVTGKRIIVSHDNADTNTVCAGSGYVGVQGDDGNEHRRTAILNRKELLTRIAKIRSEMTSTTEWDYYIQIDYWAPRLVPLETEARIWHELAVHGNIWTSLGDVIDHLTRSHQNASRYLPDLCDVGRRNWLGAVRMDLILLTDLMTTQQGAEILANLLFKI